MEITFLNTTAISSAAALNRAPPIFNGLLNETKFAASTAITDLAMKGIKWATGDCSLDCSYQTFSSFPNCMSRSCADLKDDEMEIREQQAVDATYPKKTGFFNRVKELFGVSAFREAQELLRFNINDPREKLLYLSNEWDHHGSLNPTELTHILRPLAQKFDVKFKLIKSYDEVCKEVEEGAKTGRLSYVIINGHGSPNDIRFSNPDPRNPLKAWKVDQSVLQRFPSCFSGLHTAGKIIHLSCCTGSPGTVRDNRCFNDKPPDYKTSDPKFQPLAQTMATHAKRNVIAFKTTIGPPVAISSLDPLMFYYPAEFFDNPALDVKKYWSNLAQEFKPQDPTCQNLDPKNLHPRENLAIAAMKANHVEKFLLSDSASFQETQNFLRFCEQDPKDKFLVLSAKDDPTGAFDPKEFSQVLGTTADQFDVRYKVVGSFSEVCKEIEEAAKVGQVAGVILQAHDHPNQSLLLSKDADGGILTKDMDFKKCFKPLKESATIAIVGGSGATKEDAPYQSLVQKIADESQRTIIAATDAVAMSSIRCASTESLMLEHSATGSDQKKFKKFDPLHKTFRQLLIQDWKAVEALGLTHIELGAHVKAIGQLASTDCQKWFPSYVVFYNPGSVKENTIGLGSPVTQTLTACWNNTLGVQPDLLFPENQHLGDLVVTNPLIGVKLTFRGGPDRVADYIQRYGFYEYPGRDDVGHNPYRTDPVDIAAVLTSLSPSSLREAIRK